MFQISADQTQWFHLYRVLKISPITFVIFCCEEVNEHGNATRLLDLRIVSNGSDVTGGSWCARSTGIKLVTRAECTKFLELRAKFMIATSLARSLDEIELVEASGEELMLATSLDEALQYNVAAVVPTLLSRLARSVLGNLGVNQTGVVFDEMPDWRTRNIQDVVEHRTLPESAPAREPLTTKTQRVPV